MKRQLTITLTLAALACIFWFSGCATQPTVHGIPNFGEVDGKARIYRGGEPTPEGLAWLSKEGVTNEVKLDTFSESGKPTGMTLHYFPITTWQQFWGNGIKARIVAAERAVQPCTFVHCAHGKNRTGTLIGFYRIRNGWTKAAAREEMNHYGWRDSLPGLRWFWCEVR